MPTWRRILISIALLLPLSRTVAAQVADVQEVPTDTLRDVALTALEHGRYVIYYNPRLLERFSPRLRDFFIAHEYGHIARGHHGAALATADSTYSMLRQRQELEADCYAAAQLAGHRQDVVDAALEFFIRLGPVRLDHLHPTGAQRAAMILSCLPVAVDNPPGAAY